jgi:hypothetical protein
VGATVGRTLAVAARSGISLFNYGDAKAKRKEQGDKGIKLHAAAGKVVMQAQEARLIRHSRSQQCHQCLVRFPGCRVDTNRAEKAQRSCLSQEAHAQA